MVYEHNSLSSQQRFSLREREWEVGWIEVVDAKLLQQKRWTEGRMEEVRGFWVSVCESECMVEQVQ